MSSYLHVLTGFNGRNMTHGHWGFSMSGELADTTSAVGCQLIWLDFNCNAGQPVIRDGLEHVNCCSTIQTRQARWDRLKPLAHFVLMPVSLHSFLNMETFPLLVGGGVRVPVHDLIGNAFQDSCQGLLLFTCNIRYQLTW
jgi:hypothetical protein